MRTDVEVYCYKNTLTGISIRFTICLVLRSPSVPWKRTKMRNKPIIQATEAGNDTELKEINEWTPKHTARIHVTPRGTYSQAVIARSHDDLATLGYGQ